MKKYLLLFTVIFWSFLNGQNYQPYMTVLDFPDAWDITSGDEDVIIAVLGNGIHTNHPDLINNIWNNLGEDADNDGHTLEWNGTAWVFDPGDVNGNDNDSNGYIDDFIGWNFYSNNNDVTETRSGTNYNHETSVAGILVASDI